VSKEAVSSWYALIPIGYYDSLHQKYVIQNKSNSKKKEHRYNLLHILLEGNPSFIDFDKNDIGKLL
jgi:hypothetical protein